MNRKDKIILLRGIQAGTKKLSALLPQSMRIRISKNGTTFHRNGVQVEKENFYESIRHQRPVKFHVTRG